MRTARGHDGRTVVIYTPTGERIVLSASAARASARELAEAACLALECCATQNTVVQGQFGAHRRPVQRRWQAMLHALAVQRLRLVVAALLLPIAAALASVPALVGAILLGAEVAVELVLLLTTLTVLLLAAPIAWLIAPLVMSRDECRADRPDLRLHLISGQAGAESPT